jgi:hypothetical protein
MRMSENNPLTGFPVGRTHIVDVGDDLQRPSASRPNATARRPSSVSPSRPSACGAHW